MSNRVIHFEIPAGEPQRCMDFFKTVFGWRFLQMGDEPYWFAISGDDSASGINGAVMKEVGPGQPVINTIEVDDIDAMSHNIVEQGGKIVKPKRYIPTVGWMAFFSDTEGNMHCILQPDSKAL